MPTTTNGEVSLYYETFGAAADPVLLLVNGLGSQCINFKVEFCERFAARGFRVIRFDNRDVGLSSHLKGGPKYSVDDMAADGFAVLDAAGADVAHIAGWSMGGMIVQAMAIARPERVVSMTSIMSAPGPIPALRDPDVIAAFSGPPATTRDEAAERHLAGLRAWGSPASFDVERITADAHAAFDRCWDPEGRTRQQMAIGASPSRVEALGQLKVPALVIHGDADRLVPLAAGQATADAIPGARLEVVAGMGHDYPPDHWDRIVELVTTHAHAAEGTMFGGPARSPANASDAVPATVDRQELCRQFDAAIDDLEEALRTCPDELWTASMWHVPRTDPWVWPAPGVDPVPERTDESIQQFSAFWATGMHCLWFLDFYTTADPSGFETPEYVRGGPEELPWPADGAAPLTDKVFTREALLPYLDHGRRKVRQRIETMPEDEFETRCPSGHPHAGTTLRQLLDVNLTHVREHGGQMLEFVRRHAS